MSGLRLSSESENCLMCGSNSTKAVSEVGWNSQEYWCLVVMIDSRYYLMRMVVQSIAAADLYSLKEAGPTDLW